MGSFSASFQTQMTRRWSSYVKCVTATLQFLHRNFWQVVLARAALHNGSCIAALIHCDLGSNPGFIVCNRHDCFVELWIFQWTLYQIQLTLPYAWYKQPLLCVECSPTLSWGRLVEMFGTCADPQSSRSLDGSIEWASDNFYSIHRLCYSQACTMHAWQSLSKWLTRHIARTVYLTHGCYCKKHCWKSSVYRLIIYSLSSGGLLARTGRFIWQAASNGPPLSITTQEQFTLR